MTEAAHLPRARAGAGGGWEAPKEACTGWWGGRWMRGSLCHPPPPTCPGAGRPAGDLHAAVVLEEEEHHALVDGVEAVVQLAVEARGQQGGQQAPGAPGQHVGGRRAQHDGGRQRIAQRVGVQHQRQQHPPAGPARPGSAPHVGRRQAGLRMAPRGGRAGGQTGGAAHVGRPGGAGRDGTGRRQEGGSAGLPGRAAASSLRSRALLSACARCPAPTSCCPVPHPGPEPLV